MASLFAGEPNEIDQESKQCMQKRTFGIIAVAIALTITLYDVQLDPDFSLPGEIEQTDAAQEALYMQCYELRDEQIHDTAFATIDNPDVQKEFINTSRARAASECRDEYPQQLVTVRRPFRLNLVDLHARYW
ncbi:MAG: hypothetical protein DRR15_03815 [Gammaproteobacteria bacterium]|nr:MAG: hypothetical protein DRR15_03815 [Gammaproteobacteria bacterium]